MNREMILVAQGIELALQYSVKMFSDWKDALDSILSKIDISPEEFAGLYPDVLRITEYPYLKMDVYPASGSPRTKE